MLGARAWKQNESCETAFMDAALNKYSLPERNFASFNEMYDALSAEHPNDFLPENIVSNFGSEKCDFTKESFQLLFLTSLLANQKPIKTLTSDAPSGTGLIFIAVADAVSDLPGSYILSVIFFFMVILLGLGSMIGTAEGVVTPIYDALRSKGYEHK